MAGLDVGDKGVAKVSRLGAHAGLVDLMGVRWLLSVHELPFVERRAGPVRVYENTTAMPSAFVVDCVERTERTVAALESLDPRRWAIVDTAVPVPECREGTMRRSNDRAPSRGRGPRVGDGPGSSC
jgi:hypothetical protein